MKDVIETFQFTIQKKLGNYTKKYQKMLTRKKDTTTFLTKLTSNFEKWIEEIEWHTATKINPATHRIYGPKKEAVDGSWMPNNVEEIQ